MRHFLRSKLFVLVLLLSFISVLLQPIQVFAATAPPTLGKPLPNTTYAMIPVEFTMPDAPLANTPTVSFTNTSTSATIAMNFAASTSGTHSYSINPQNLGATSGMVSVIGGSSIPDGNYTVTFSYQNSVGDPVAMASVANVTVNTGSSGIMLTSLSPVANTPSVSTTPTLTLDFNQPMDIGSGNITIRQVSSNSVAATIPVGGAAVTGGGTPTISIAVGSALTAGTDYYVTVDAGALENTFGNPYAGISGSTTWRFRTAGTAPDTPAPPATGYERTGAGISGQTIAATAAFAAVPALVVLTRRYERRKSFVGSHR